MWYPARKTTRLGSESCIASLRNLDQNLFLESIADLNPFKLLDGKSRMKCKRCRAIVPDDAESCPSCGQDLSSLRELLNDFYSEEPTRSGERDVPPREPEVFSVKEEKPPDRSGGTVHEEPRKDPNCHRPLSRLRPETIFPPGCSRKEEPGKRTKGLPAGIGPCGAASGFGTWRWLRIRSILLLLLAIFVVLGFLNLDHGGHRRQGDPAPPPAPDHSPGHTPPGVGSHAVLFYFFPCHLGPDDRQDDLWFASGPDRRAAAFFFPGPGAGPGLFPIRDSLLPRLSLGRVERRANVPGTTP